MPKRSRKRDEVEEALRVVEEATGGRLTEKPAKRRKNPHAVALGRRGGKKGGPARAAKLSPEERSAIAKTAALSRWRTEPKPKE